MLFRSKDTTALTGAQREAKAQQDQADGLRATLEQTGTVEVPGIGKVTKKEAENASKAPYPDPRQKQINKVLMGPGFVDPTQKPATVAATDAQPAVPNFDPNKTYAEGDKVRTDSGQVAIRRNGNWYYVEE